MDMGCDWSIKRVLVTGANGFIGSHLVRRLVQLQAQVGILIRPDSNPWRLQGVEGITAQYDLNLQDGPGLRAMIRDFRPMIVFHLASEGVTSPARTTTPPYEVNVEAARNVFEGCLELSSPPSIIHSGSWFEYGPQEGCLCESLPARPSSSYARSKAVVTRLGRYLARTRQLPVITLRLFSVFGPYESPTRLVPSVIIHCLQNRDIPLTQGFQKRDFIYVENIVDALVCSAEMSRVASGKILNIGTQSASSIRELVEQVRMLTRSESRPLYGKIPDRAGEPSCVYADLNQTRDTIHWSPRIDLKDGLQRTIAWFQKNAKLSEVNAA